MNFVRRWIVATSLLLPVGCTTYSGVGGSEYTPGDEASADRYVRETQADYNGRQRLIEQMNDPGNGDFRHRN